MTRPRFTPIQVGEIAWVSGESGECSSIARQPRWGNARRRNYFFVRYSSIERDPQYYQHRTLDKLVPCLNSFTQAQNVPVCLCKLLWTRACQVLCQAPAVRQRIGINLDSIGHHFKRLLTI